MISPRAAVLLLCATVAVSGCVVVPVVSEGYDPDCRVVTHHVELQAVDLVRGRWGCNGGNECGAVLVAGVGIAAASAVVSGSIAVVSNVGYEAQRRMNCTAGTEPPVPVAAPVPVAQAI